MNKTLKDDFTYHWGLATCTLEDDERVIANEQLESILQSDLFEDEKEEERQFLWRSKLTLMILRKR